MNLKVTKWNIGLFILSIILMATLFRPINYLIGKVLPQEEVVIRVIENSTERVSRGTEVWILNHREVTNHLEYPEIQDYKVIEGDWEYRDKNEWKYDASSLVSFGKNAGSAVKIVVKKTPAAALHFWMHPNAGVVEVTSSKSTRIYDLYSEEVKTKFVFPFEDSKLVLFILILIYGVGTIMFFSVLSGIWKLFCTIEWPKWVYDYHPLRTSIGVFGFIFVYNIICYFRGVEYFYLFGDAGYYWKHNPMTEGITWEVVAKGIYPPRGYIISTGTVYIARLLGEITKIDAILWYMFYMAIIFAWFIGYIMPKLYEILSGRSATNYQVILFCTIISAFWRSFYYLPLSDFMAIIFLFAGIYYGMLYFKSEKFRYSFWSGIFTSISIMSRLTYKNSLYIATLAGIIGIVIYLAKKDYAQTKKHVISMCVFWLGIFIIAIPQMAINFTNGHKGIFPYDAKGVWVLPDKSLGEWSSSVALENITGYPYVTSDSVTQNIKKDTYLDAPYELTYSQSLYGYVRKPLSTITTIIKRIFAGLDIKRSNLYAQYGFNGQPGVYLFSFCNYFVLGLGALLAFYKGKSKLNKNEIIFLSLAFSILVLPQTYLQVEWRYFLGGYIVLYYIASYCFGNILFQSEERKEFENKGYSLWLSLVIILSFIMSLNLYNV